MTDKQRDLIQYIEDHGHHAIAHSDNDHLVVTSSDKPESKHWEIIPALWLPVREWLGY